MKIDDIIQRTCLKNGFERHWKIRKMGSVQTQIYENYLHNLQKRGKL